MDTTVWSEGPQNQAFGVQASNATMQTDSRFQCFMPGGQIHGNMNTRGGQSQPTQHSNNHNLHYASPNGQTASGNYWNYKATDLNSVQNCGSFAAQWNGSGPYDPAAQLQLRNQTLNGNERCIAQSGPYTPQSHYATHQNPLNANAPRMVVANGMNPQMTRTATEGLPHTQETQQSSRVDGGVPPPGAQVHGQFALIESIKTFLKGRGGNPYADFYGQLPRNSRRHAVQERAVTGQGVMSGGTVEKSRRKGVNGSSDAVAHPMREVANMDRGNDKRENLASPVFSSAAQHANSGHLKQLLSQSQGTVGRSGAAPPPYSQTSSWSASSGVNTDTVKGMGSGSGTVCWVPERTNSIQPRNSTTDHFATRLINAAIRVGGNASTGQLGVHRNASGNFSSVQNAEEQQPSTHFMSGSAGSNFSANSSRGEERSCYVSPAGPQLPRAQDPMTRHAQEAEHITQSYNGTTLRPVVPKPLNNRVMWHGPTQTAKPSLNQIPQSSFENRNGPPHALGNGSGVTSNFPNQAKQPHRPVPDNRASGDPPPYPKTQRYFVTVTQDSSGTGFTAKNVIFMADNHTPAFSEQLTSKEKTAKGASGTTYNELAESSNPNNCETQLSTAIVRSESVFSVPKPANPSVGSSGQRAVAVVPPISQQSSNSADEGCAIINTNEGLPFKINNVWSITEEEYVQLDENLKPNILATCTPAACADSSSPSLRAASPLQKIAPASDLVSTSVCPTDTLTVAEKDTQISSPSCCPPESPEVAHQTEKTSCSSINVNDSETPPSSGVDEHGDQNGESKNFELSSVPAFEWTIRKLRRLAEILNLKQVPLQVEMDIDKVHSIYGSCSYQDYKSIVNEASSISTEDDQAVVFSQIRRQFLKEVADNCLILEHGAIYPGTVYKSSWLNLNEQLDDIDKEEGFPLHLRFRQHMPEDKFGSKEVNESETGNLPPEPTVVEVPISPKASSPIKDPLSSIEISVLPSEGVNNCETGNLPPEPTVVEVPTSPKASSPTKDPLSSIEISVLPSEGVNNCETGNLPPELTVVEMPESPKDLSPTKDPPSLEISVLPSGEWAESENGNLQPALREEELPASPKGLSHSSDPLSSIKVNVLPSKEVNRSENGNRAEVSVEQEVGGKAGPQLLTQTELIVSEGVNDFKDPLSSIEISVLSGEDARKFFIEITEETENPQSEILKPDSVETKGQTAVEVPEWPLKDTKKMDVYCCLARWLCDMTGYGSKCVCSCRTEDESDQMKGKPGESKNDNNVVPAAGTLGGVPSTTAGAAHSVPGVGTANLDGAKTVRGSSDKCLVTAQKSPSHPEQGSCHSAKRRNSGPPSGQKCEKRMKPLSQRSGGEDPCDPEAPPSSTSSATNVTEVEIQDVFSSYSEVLKIASTTSEPLWSRCNPKVPLHANVVGSDTSHGSTGTGNASLESKVVAKCGNFKQQVESLNTKGLKWGVHFHEHQTSNKNRNHKDESITKKDCKIRKRKRETSNPKSACDRSASDLDRRNKEKKPCSEAAAATKMTVAEHETRMKYIKCKGDSPPESLQSKVAESEHSRNAGVKNSVKEKTLRNGKVLLVVSKQPETTNSVSLALYGSTPQKRNGTLHSLRRSDSEPGGPRTQDPPTTICLSVPSSETNPFQHSPPAKSLAKQQVFAKWKSSFVPEKDNRRRKTRRLKKNEERPRNSKVNKLVLERVKPKRVEQRRSTVPDTRMKSQYELRNPAPAPPQQDDGMLQFKVLPESFSFKDGQDHRESLKPKETRKTWSARTDSRQSESQKMTTWKVQGHQWSKSSKGKVQKSTEARSPAAATQSGTTFQEYKEKYMAKGRKS